MPVIQADDSNIKKILGQKQPAIVVLYDGSSKDKPLHDALKREAKKRGDDLLVIKIDASQNPDSLARFDNPQTLPALVTLTKAFFGRSTKTCAEAVRPSDIRAHIAHLLDDQPLPEDEEEHGDDAAVNSSAKKVTETTFRKDVLKSKTPVLVDFWAEWCGPCKTISPFIDTLADKYAGKVKVMKLNVDENKQLANRFQVQSIPTFILFDGGQPVERFSGSNPTRIEDMIREALYVE